MLHNYFDAKAARPFALSGLSGLIGPNFPANQACFAMRLSTSAPVDHRLFLTRFHAEVSSASGTAFSPPTQADRCLRLLRGAGAAIGAGGAALEPVKKDSSLTPPLYLSTALGGASWISLTTIVSTTGITFEAPIATLNLVALGSLENSFGSTGGTAALDMDWDAEREQPLVLAAGQVLALKSVGAFDAAGSWVLIINVEGFEAPIL